MSSRNLINFPSIPGYRELLSGFEKSASHVLISLPRSVRLPFIASIQEDLKKTIVFVTSKSDRLLSMYEEYSFWAENANRHIFSEPSPLFFERSGWSPRTRFDRINTLAEIVQRLLPGSNDTYPNSVIFTSVKSLMTKTIPRRDFIKHSLSLKTGMHIEISRLVNRLIVLSYEPVDIVVAGGQFSRRGGIVDIWPSDSNEPVRIEYFGDEIDTMRVFDPASQRSVTKTKDMFIPPAREILQLENEKIKQTPNGALTEFHIPVAFSSAGTIIDYIPKDSIIIFDNASSLQATADEIEAQSLKIKAENEDLGNIPRDFPDPFFTWSEVLDEVSRCNLIDLGFPLSEEGHQISRSFSPSPRFGSRLDDMFRFLNEKEKKIERVFIVSKQINRIKEVQGTLAEREIPPEKIIYIDGRLNAGWRVEYPGKTEEYLFSDSELFGWELPRPRRKKHHVSEAPETSFADFYPGDFVVHVDYGIAKFSGLVQRTIEGINRDYLLLNYADDDELFVPVHQVDRINSYIGPDNRKPKLSKLGSANWHSKRSRTKQAVKEIAFDLLELYAARQTVKGYAFREDTNWQIDLEAGFPYEETNDQARAIEEVKSDMEMARPMDRLLCGDVGYGKTEVALRSAFKAVMDNKQVAILVPTTVLAQQHYETFKARLAPFPVRVEMLSRFRSASEQVKILLSLEAGEIDIVIGTHRLLQNDVNFKDLGLMVIDEEQRFGVTHKEYFKKMRKEIDVLTLTATPIPRTLNMALSGIRDISVINSPPAERLPIMTFTGPYDEKIVRKAIIREIDRGGQIFFVHNRVQSIQVVANQLEKLVPEARIGIAHGQMKERNLSKVMMKFNSGDLDVLLSTSIIESGLDIPNANTIILDRADAFGLAQLYQLRGRVGRGSSRAYAYFFHHNKRLPTPEGLERLEIIAENTQLGAGYSIAMRDLEMRGAGDLLGARQHGYIASVGFHLYTRLLSEAVNNLKGKTGFQASVEKLLVVKTIKPLVSVELPLSVLIPLEYVKDESLRLQLYRRIADLQDENEISSIIEEFDDRFGTPPAEVINLLFQLRVKLTAEKCGLSSIAHEGKHIIIKFPSNEEGEKKKELPDLGRNVRRGKYAYWMPIASSLDWRVRLMQALNTLAEEIKG